MWFFYALTAAVLWGMSYTIYSVLLKSLPPAGMMSLISVGACAVYVTIAMVRGDLATSIGVVQQQPRLLLLTLVTILCVSSAMFLLFYAMKESNPTVAALVEISYPLFVALFSWIFLKEGQMNMGTLAGALLIMAGISCVFYFNRHIGA